jgi:hypothetical protein
MLHNNNLKQNLTDLHVGIIDLELIKDREELF